MSSLLEWIPAGSNPGNGRGDPPPVPDQLNSPLKESRITLPPNSNGYHSLASPMLTPPVKAHLLARREWSYVLNPYRPVSNQNYGMGPLVAAPENGCTCVWLNGERQSVQYAQGRGILRVKTGTILYDGEFDQGFRHGAGVSNLIDLGLGPGKYAGNWVWGTRQGWGRMTLEDGTVYEGNWKLDQLSGVVRVTSADGSVYTGLYRNGVREGCGRFQWPAGQVEDHLYQSGGLVSKVLYSGRASDGVSSLGGIAPTLPFLEAFLLAKAGMPPLPESQPPTPESAFTVDPAVESLTGALKLPEKMSVREIDEIHCATATTALTEVIGQPVTVRIDWDSINASEFPRRTVYTLDYEKSTYILQPLVASFANVCSDPLGKESLQGKVKNVILRHSPKAVKTTVVLEEEENCIVITNLECGRGSTIQAAELQAEIEKAL